VGDVFHDHPKREAVENAEAEFTNEHEHFGKEVGPCVLDDVLEVQEEAVPSSRAETVT